MAKIVVLTDRSPADLDWKGAFVWKTIRELAENHHQVLALTTLEVSTIRVEHPRLTIAQPAANWSVKNFFKFLQAIALFNPQVIQSFAFKTSPTWSGLSLWPALNLACLTLPKIKRFITLFEANDLTQAHPASGWYKNSKLALVHSQSLQHLASQKLSLQAEVLPLDVEASPSYANSNDLLVPAPISLWIDRELHLSNLNQFLKVTPNATVSVWGGWGELPTSERRRAWEIFAEVSDRVRLLENKDFTVFLEFAKSCESLWTRGLPQDCWPSLVASQVAKSLGLKHFGEPAGLMPGSTANELSRIYAMHI